eukprot:CAMPEP_0118873580 /NCGR_PEP_ID=MMETSP1163-20130328/15332_1 /TAXON_ID=124430 /ORGANISM="Phaeomonas parva, Strain CCMP2877" /LENGTH=197 /DNA_ID=CAMNT_0006808871 /DNA_START=135 /DNA_END=725 /DNA_ORIENTATION=+
MEDIWGEALANYLQSESWQGQIQGFVHRHRFRFLRSDDEEFSHDHYALWREYQELVERLMEAIVAEIGGSLEALEKALLDKVDTNPRGPRDATQQQLLSKLLTYHDFGEFSNMMRAGLDEEEPPLSPRGRSAAPPQPQSYDEVAQDDDLDPSDMRAQLIAMGFHRENVMNVCEWAQDIGEAIQVLQDMPAPEPPKPK